VKGVDFFAGCGQMHKLCPQYLVNIIETCIVSKC